MPASLVGLDRDVCVVGKTFYCYGAGADGASRAFVAIALEGGDGVLDAGFLPVRRDGLSLCFILADSAVGDHDDRNHHYDNYSDNDENPDLILGPRNGAR
ncbi:hypothetical protein D3C85_229820 [compost metagenome]